MTTDDLFAPIQRNHPDLHALFHLANSDDLVVAEGSDGQGILMITSMAPHTPRFMFTKTATGYTLERLK
jgi:uncharacterized surface anchored protein